MSKKLAEIAVGDLVLRWFGGIPKPMRLKVTRLTADRIICSAWEFDRQSGAEIDEDLGWGPGGVTGSFLEPESGTDPEEDFRSRALQRLAALLDAGKIQQNRGESIAEAMRRRLNGMTEEQVSRMLYELESGEPSWRMKIIVLLPFILLVRVTAHFDPHLFRYWDVHSLDHWRLWGTTWKGYAIGLAGWAILMGGLYSLVVWLW